jgi:hypothetical protein
VLFGLGEREEAPAAILRTGPRAWGPVQRLARGRRIDVHFFPPALTRFPGGLWPGIAQLRDDDRDAGRASLREALDLADCHDADAVAARAHAELTIAGARPRRRRLTGPEALTAAELRIARMAAEGRSNAPLPANCSSA